MEHRPVRRHCNRHPPIRARLGRRWRRHRHPFRRIAGPRRRSESQHQSLRRRRRGNGLTKLHSLHRRTQRRIRLRCDHRRRLGQLVRGNPLPHHITSRQHRHRRACQGIASPSALRPVRRTDPRCEHARSHADRLHVRRTRRSGGTGHRLRRSNRRTAARHGRGNRAYGRRHRRFLPSGRHRFFGRTPVDQTKRDRHRF